MKILLIRSITIEYDHPPLGLLYVASMLEKAGHQVEVVDMSASKMTWEDLEKRIKESNPDVIGTTSITLIFDKALKVMEIAKKTLPNVPTVIGGPYASDLKDQILKENNFIDFLIYGEGEFTMAELVQAISTDKNFENIKGLVYRKDGNVVMNPPRELFNDLDSIPFPAKHLLQKEKYTRYGTVLTSRGCPYNCIFCDKAVIQPSWRGRSPENVISEIEMLINQYGLKTFEFVDDLFSFSEERAIKICDMIIEKKFNIKWYCNNGLRVNHVSENLLKKMKEAGCAGIFFGIESGNQDILNKMRKGITVEQAYKAIEMTRRIGIEAGGYFIVGLPGETPETVKDTYEFIKKSSIDRAQVNLALPLPNTDLWKWIEKNGRFITKDFNYFNVHGGTSVFETDDFSNADRVRLYKWLVKEKSKIMLRRRIIRNIPKILEMNPKEVVRKSKIFFNIVKGIVYGDSSLE